MKFLNEFLTIIYMFIDNQNNSETIDCVVCQIEIVMRRQTVNVKHGIIDRRIMKRIRMIEQVENRLELHNIINE